MSSGDRKVAMLVLRDENVDWNDARAKTMFDEFVAWTADLAKRGLLHDVEGLTREGKTVRKKGASIVIDGPYAEGREAVLGFVSVLVADFDEACKLAGECPYVIFGGAMEVRMSSGFPKPAKTSRKEG